MVRHGGHRRRCRAVGRRRAAVVGRVLDGRKLRVDGRNLRFWLKIERGRALRAGWSRRRGQGQRICCW